MSNNTVDALVTFLVLSVNHVTAVMADAAIPDGELLPLIEHCRVSAVFADGKNVEKMLGTQRVPVLMTYGLRSCGKIVSEGSSARSQAEPTPDAVAIMFSSGTTARRKSVELSYQSILITHRKIRDMGVLHSGKPNRSMLEVFPMSHVSGLYSAFTLLYEGLSIVTVETISSDALTDAFKVFKPFAFGMVPKVHDLFIGKFEDELRKRRLYGIYTSLGKRSRAAIRRTHSLRTSRRLMMPFRSLHIDVMIDDKPENLVTIAKEHAVIACPMPWNRALEAQGFVRAKDWQDIYDIITRGFRAPGKLSSGQFSARNGRQPRAERPENCPVDSFQRETGGSPGQSRPAACDSLPPERNSSESGATE